MMRKCDIYRAEREKGLSISQVAKKYGVSYQAVAQCFGKSDPMLFTLVTEKQCVYPKWREWMNKNKISRSELCRRLWGNAWSASSQRVSDYMKGKSYPPKRTIDKLLNIMDLKYEELFLRGE